MNTSGSVPCGVCGSDHQDCRNLEIACKYDFSEISPKFKREPGPGGRYSMVICKDCRGSLLGMLRYWAEGGLIEDSSQPDRTIPVRIDGRVVMMNDLEWKAHTAKNGESDRKPIHFR